jgi:hypothetical protein
LAWIRTADRVLLADAPAPALDHELAPARAFELSPRGYHGVALAR